MTYLEDIIMKLTRETTSGGTCRVGDASITVRYCSDIWEWDYGGRTFWDVHDLAEAIVQDCIAFPTKLPYKSKMARTVRDALDEETSPGEFFLEPPERPWGQAL
jgi:hypothetical protein